MSALCLAEVTKTYGAAESATGRSTMAAVHALQSVSLNVERGELAAVVGPSGSGKSTLLAIAGTLERPSSGRVSVDGSPVEDLTDRELALVRAERIGFVFQQFFLIPSLSTLDNVATGLLYHGTRMEERRREARRALEAVGLGHRADHRPGELSGGECQRAAIARALVGRPSIILADEPTGNVDSRQSAEITALLKELNTQGATIVVVTHDEEVARSVPRVIRLRDGRIEEDTGRP
jgi:putative ABC transport system ATP-binding protein